MDLTRLAYVDAYAASLDTVFVLAASVGAAGFLLTLLLPERPLRRTIAATAGDAGTDVGGTFARPVAPNSDNELQKGLAIFANRDVQREHIAQIVSRAGVSLSPGAAWLLVRIEREPAIEHGPLAQRFHIPLDRLAAMEDELVSAKLVTRAGSNDGGRALTPAGCAVLDRLLEARRAHLAELIAEWPVEQRDSVLQHLRAIAQGLVPEVARR